MYRGHVYVPKDPQLCHDIVHAHHDSVMTGVDARIRVSVNPI